jgi:hypothetical protein
LVNMAGMFLRWLTNVLLDLCGERIEWLHDGKEVHAADVWRSAECNRRDMSSLDRSKKQSRDTWHCEVGRFESTAAGEPSPSAR